MEEVGDEDRPLPMAARKFRKIVLPAELIQPVPPFCPVPKPPGSVLGEATFWGSLPHITVHEVLDDARKMGGHLVSDQYDRSQEEAIQREEELRQQELERQLEAAKPVAPPRFFVVFSTPADLDQALESKKWPIRNPLTEKALNAALLEEGQVVLLFRSRDGFQGHATLLSLVEEEDEDDGDFLSTWYNIAWGTRAVLPTQDAANLVDPLPTEGVTLAHDVGSSICEALDNLYDSQDSGTHDHHTGPSEAPRGDNRAGNRGRRWGGDSRWGKHRSSVNRSSPRSAHLRYAGEVPMPDEGRSQGGEQPSRRHDHQRGEERSRHSGRDFSQHQPEAEFRPPSADDDVRRRMSEMARNGRRTEGGQRAGTSRRSNRYSDWSDDPPSQ